MGAGVAKFAVTLRGFVHPRPTPPARLTGTGRRGSRESEIEHVGRWRVVDGEEGRVERTGDDMVVGVGDGILQVARCERACGAGMY